MSLKQDIQSQMIEAMKAKEEVRLGALRMVKAAIMKAEVSGSEKKELSDEEVMGILQKEIKSRKDSAEQFRAGGREESALKEEAEIAVLEKFLPEQMSEEEITVLVKEAIATTGASSKQDMGKVMGALMPKVKGKADGGLVNKIVGGLLG